MARIAEDHDSNSRLGGDEADIRGLRMEINY